MLTIVGEMKIGDRVIAANDYVRKMLISRHNPEFKATVVGYSYKSDCVRIIQDGLKTKETWSKSFWVVQDNDPCI